MPYTGFDVSQSNASNKKGRNDERTIPACHGSRIDRNGCRACLFCAGNAAAQGKKES